MAETESKKKNLSVFTKGQVRDLFLSLPPVSKKNTEYHERYNQIVTQVTPGQRGRVGHTDESFQNIQNLIDKVYQEGYSYSKLTNLVASHYNVQFPGKAIDKISFKRWMETGKIKMPVAPVKRVKVTDTEIVETTPAGETVTS